MNEPSPAPAPGGRAIPWLLRAWLAVVVLFLLPAWITMPFGRDQGIFAQVGTIMLQGGLPYADAWEVKGPLTFFIVEAGFRLLGPGEAGYNGGFLLLFLPTLALASHEMRRWSGAATGALAALLLLNKSKMVYWNLGQPDTVIGCFAGVLICVTARIEGERDTPRALLAGALCAAAAWIKPPFILLAAAPVGALVWAYRGRWRALAGQAAWFSLGGCAVTFAVLLPFALGGALDSLWEVLVAFNLSSHAGQARLGSWPSLLPRWSTDTWVRIDFLFACAKITGAGLMLARRPRLAIPLLAAWLACYVAAGSQGKFWDQHFIPMDMLGMLFAAYALSLALTRAAGSIRSPATALAALALVAGLYPSLYAQCRALNTGVRWWQHQAGWMDEREWLRPCVAEGFNLASIRDAAAAARRFSAPGEALYLWGFDSLLNVEADRPPPTRFIFNYPLLVGAPAYVARCRAELMRDLAARPPRLIAVQDRDANPLYRYTSREKLAEFPELAGLISASYRECHRNDHFTLHQRVSP